MGLKTAVPMILLLLLTGCGAERASAQTAVSFRTSLNEAAGCSFQAEVTADYGDHIREYTLECSCTPAETGFTVVAPEQIAGITATVTGEDAAVSYEGTILAVEEFSTRRISPMAAPCILERAWREGYVQATGMDGDLEQVEYRLGYGSAELTVMTVFSQGIPRRGEISDGKNNLITCNISEFTLH